MVSLCGTPCSYTSPITSIIPRRLYGRLSRCGSSRGQMLKHAFDSTLDNPTRSDTAALDTKHSSGVISLKDMSNVVAFTWDMDELILRLERQRGELHYPTTLYLGLRDLVTLMHPHNKRELLELIDMQTLSEAQAGESVPDRLPGDQEAAFAPELELSKLGHDAGRPPTASELEKAFSKWPQKWARNWVWICLGTFPKDLRPPQGYTYLI
jgi:hypothetical protein